MSQNTSFYSEPPEAASGRKWQRHPGAPVVTAVRNSNHSFQLADSGETPLHWVSQFLERVRSGLQAWLSYANQPVGAPASSHLLCLLTPRASVRLSPSPQGRYQTPHRADPASEPASITQTRRY